MSVAKSRGVRTRVLALVGAVALTATGGLVTALVARAAPLPATYTGTTSGDVLTLQSSLLGSTLAATTLVHSGTAVDSSLVATPASATSANLGAQVGPLGVAATNTTTAPPTRTASGTLVGANLPGVLSTGVVTYTDSAAWNGATACVPAGTPIAQSTTSTANVGLTLTPTLVPPLGSPITVASTGAVSTTTSTQLVQTSAVHDTRAVQSTATGNVAGLSLLNGLVTVSTLQPTLTTTATSGASTSATLTGSTVTVTGPLGAQVLAPGATVNVTTPIGSVALHLSSNAEIAQSGGAFSTTYLTAAITLLGGTGTVNLGILPLSVSATAPTGGVECDTTPPAIAITSPTTGSTVNTGTPPITGTSDVISGPVQVSVDGGTPVTVTTDASGNWSFTPTTPLAEGPHTATANATDAAGNTGTASTTFTVDILPTVAITTPANGSVINDATPAITGTSTQAGGTITLTVDGTPVVVPTDASGGWSFTPLVPLAQGSHTVTATATDAQANVATASSTFTVDTIPPTVAITSPANGSTTNDSTPTVAGTSDVVSGPVQVSIDGGAPVAVTTDATGHWSLTSPTLTNGPHVVTASATDAAGNTGTATSSFTVAAASSAAPAVHITSPGAGQQVSDRTPTITGTGTPGATVTVTVDGQSIGTALVDASGQWSLAPSSDLSCGQHTVRASASGPTPSADQVTFTITCPAAAAAGSAGSAGAASGGAAPATSAGLAFTGADAAPALAVGALLLLLGAALIGTSARRRRTMSIER